MTPRLLKASSGSFKSGMISSNAALMNGTCDFGVPFSKKAEIFRPRSEVTLPGNRPAAST